MKKWTDEAIRAEAAKYQSRNDFKHGSKGAYNAAIGKGKVFFEGCCQHMVAKYEYWTDEAIRAKALEYQTRNDFKHGSKGAYQSARKKGKDFFESCCQHMIAHYASWTDDSIRAEAAKYQSRNDFKRGSESTYRSARKKGKDFFESCCQHMIAKYEYWTDEAIRAKALEYQTRNDFKHGSKGAYNAAKGKGKVFFEGCCQHMVAHYASWTDDSIRAEALTYTTRNDFKHGSKGAYNAAWERGEEFAESCMGHMIKMAPSDNDAIYIWKAEREFYNGEPVYKIGVTSARLGMRRIKIVAQESGFTATTVALVKVSGRASSVEKKLLALGQDPKYMNFDGATEFRAMSDAELQRALDILNEHAADDELLAA